MAALAAMAPSWGAESDLKEPLKTATGVLAALTMTTSYNRDTTISNLLVSMGLKN